MAHREYMELLASSVHSNTYSKAVLSGEEITTFSLPFTLGSLINLKIFLLDLIFFFMFLSNRYNDEKYGIDIIFVDVYFLSASVSTSIEALPC